MFIKANYHPLQYFMCYLRKLLKVGKEGVKMPKMTAPTREETRLHTSDLGDILQLTNPTKGDHSASTVTIAQTT